MPPAAMPPKKSGKNPPRFLSDFFSGAVRAALDCAGAGAGVGGVDLAGLGAADEDFVPVLADVLAAVLAVVRAGALVSDFLSAEALLLEDVAVLGPAGFADASGTVDAGADVDAVTVVLGEAVCAADERA